MNNIDNRWENAIAFYSYVKENPDKKTYYSKNKKIFYIKEKILQIIKKGKEKVYVFKTFYIDPREYF